MRAGSGGQDCRARGEKACIGGTGKSAFDYEHTLSMVFGYLRGYQFAVVRAVSSI